MLELRLALGETQNVRNRWYFETSLHTSSTKSGTIFKHDLRSDSNYLEFKTQFLAVRTTSTINHTRETWTFKTNLGTESKILNFIIKLSGNAATIRITHKRETRAFKIDIWTDK